MTESYIIQPNTIVLCVVPATTPRITSYTPIAMLKKHNKIKDTIMVLIMCDRVQENNIYELIVERICRSGDEFEDMVFAGCNAVINRDRDRKTLMENDVEETNWFKTNVINKTPKKFIHSKRLFKNIGTSILIDNIDIFYNKYIEDHWIPQTIEMLKKDLLEKKNTHDNLGPSELKYTTLTNVNLKLLCDNVRCMLTYEEFFKNSLSYHAIVDKHEILTDELINDEILKLYDVDFIKHFTSTFYNYNLADKTDTFIGIEKYQLSNITNWQYLTNAGNNQFEELNFQRFIPSLINEILSDENIKNIHEKLQTTCLAIRTRFINGSDIESILDHFLRNQFTLIIDNINYNNINEGEKNILIRKNLVSEIESLANTITDVGQIIKK